VFAIPTHFMAVPLNITRYMCSVDNFRLSKYEMPPHPKLKATHNTYIQDIINP